ncbi:MAG: hypothetical protein ABFC71_07150 [Methanoregula sp.]
MNSIRFGTFLSALLLAGMVLTPCVSAYQASSYGVYYDTIDTRATGQVAANELTSMGYSASYIENPSASSVFLRMPSDNVFFVDGHGSPGQIVFQHNGVDSAISASNPGLIRLSSFTSGELNDVALAVYVACNTANTDSTNGNLLYESTSRGVDTAVGFSNYITSPQSEYWSNRFWYYLDERYNIHDAAVYSLIDTRAQYGLLNPGGMDSYVIQGSISSAIDPARAGY